MRINIKIRGDKKTDFQFNFFQFAIKRPNYKG